MAELEDRPGRLVLPGEHALRRRLNDELHARPFMQVEAPQEALHFAVLSGDDPARDLETLRGLCASLGAAPPAQDTHYSAAAGAVRLKWERHAEFSTYTFFSSGAGEQGDDALASSLPADWLAAVAPDLLVASRLTALRGAGRTRDPAAAEAWLGAFPLAGSLVLGGGAEIWTDFRIRESGFSHFLLIDIDLRERQAGRLVQRLFEIETYRMMALTALPAARVAGAEISALDRRITRTIDALADARERAAERDLLGRITEVAAEVEHLIARTAFRLSAAAAYHSIVESRLAELREERIEGVPTFEEFLHRRLAPAMQTCRSVGARQEALSLRVARAAELLRTRVEIALQDQNRALLESMDRRAQVQLRLQQTVEGLSIIAITYYASALVGHVLEPLHALGWVARPDLVLGAAVPVILVIVALAIRRLRRHLHE